MKLKYYLNGFGIGVLFATVILSVAFLIRSSSNDITDEEVIARARALGMEMVSAEKENPTTSEAAVPETTTTESETTEEQESTTSEPETTEEQESTTTEPETTTAEPETTTEPLTTTVEPATTSQQTGEPERIAFEIVSGMTSESVAELLAKKGVISDAKAFNAYVVEQGYAGRIRTGNYEIISSASYDEIIGFICR